jgi:hypothetical protein
MLQNKKHAFQYRSTWRDIALTISYVENWCSQYDIAHIEVTSENRVPLPITETGYKSIFTGKGNIASYGGALEYVLAMLDDAAQSKAWQSHEEQAKQYSLF